MLIEKSKLRGRFIEMPFAFTGMGIFRAWTETVYSNGSISFPAQQDTGFDFAIFNLLNAAVLLALALSSSKIAPLYGKRWASWTAASCMILSASMNFLSIYQPGLSWLLGMPAAVLGAIGISLILLLWSELFGCLNPFRVTLYFSGGIVVGALILWLFKGLALPWLWVCTCAVPLLSLFCLKRAYALLPDNERPHATWGERTFPWKPIAVVALYSFSYGMCESVFVGDLGIHSGVGCVAAAAFVYGYVCLKRDLFHLSIVCRIACPLMLLSLAPLGAVLPWGASVSGFCALCGYTLMLIAVMVVLSNLTYQYGFNAVWLFGIERAARLLSVQSGLTVTAVFSGSTHGYLLFCVLVALMIIVATLLFLSERHLATPWGTVLRTLEGKSYESRSRIGAKCNELGELYGLTDRESEILLLLVQGKKQGQIAGELYIAGSTVKTHIKHIYQKLDVHSRKDLAQLVGVDEKS